MPEFVATVMLMITRGSEAGKEAFTCPFPPGSHSNSPSPDPCVVWAPDAPSVPSPLLGDWAH